MLIGFPCLFHLLTGLYCPGCGGTRAVIHLLHGHPAVSFQYHPLVIYIVAVAAIIAFVRIAEGVTHNRYLQIKHYTLFTYAGFGIVAVNFIIKNYFLIVKGIDLLP